MKTGRSRCRASLGGVCTILVRGGGLRVRRGPGYPGRGTIGDTCCRYRPVGAPTQEVDLQAVRTIITEQGAWCETLFGTFPSMKRLPPCMPLLPTTIRWAFV